MLGRSRPSRSLEPQGALAGASVYPSALIVTNARLHRRCRQYRQLSAAPANFKVGFTAGLLPDGMFVPGKPREWITTESTAVTRAITAQGSTWDVARAEFLRPTA